SWLRVCTCHVRTRRSLLFWADLNLNGKVHRHAETRLYESVAATARRPPGCVHLWVSEPEVQGGCRRVGSRAPGAYRHRRGDYPVRTESSAAGNYRTAQDR